MAVRSVLVAVDHSAGRAGVVSDASDALWLSSSVDEVSGERVDGFQPAAIPVGPGLCAFGGRLPPGAVAAEAVAANGKRVTCAVDNGAWVVAVLGMLTSMVSPPVVFRDKHGAFVLPPLPTAWPRTPVADTDVPCPACDAVAWDEVIPLDGLRATRSGATIAQVKPAPVLVCRTCGHEEIRDVIIRTDATAPLSDAVAQAVRVRLQQRIQERYGAQLRALPFPVYGVEGWPEWLSGINSNQHGVRAVTVSHGAWVTESRPYINVDSGLSGTYPNVDSAVTVREALAEHLRRIVDNFPVLSGAAFAPQANASITSRKIPVDGLPLTFSYAEASTAWAAAGTTASGLTITMTADGVNPDAIRLHRTSIF